MSAELEMRVEKARLDWMVLFEYWRSADQLSGRLEREIGRSVIARGAHCADVPSVACTEDEYWEARAARLEFECALGESMALARIHGALERECAA